MCHLWQLFVPAEHIYSNQLEHAPQWWQDLFGEVVGRVEAESGVLQYLHRLSHQLNEGHARCPTHNNIGHPLTHAWLRASIICHHTPKIEKHQRKCMNTLKKMLVLSLV